MTPGVAKWISLACIILGLLGWSAIVLVAKVYPGGHPPLVAYVAIPVLLGLVPINLIGFVMSIRSLMTTSIRSNKVVAGLTLIGNVVLLIVGGYSLFG